jgi:hypothetical protein
MRKARITEEEMVAIANRPEIFEGLFGDDRAKTEWLSNSSKATFGRGCMGMGLHLAGGSTSLDLYCSAGGRFWPMTSLAALQHHTRFLGNSRLASSL